MGQQPFLGPHVQAYQPVADLHGWLRFARYGTTNFCFARMKLTQNAQVLFRLQCYGLLGYLSVTLYQMNTIFVHVKAIIHVRSLLHLCKCHRLKILCPTFV